MDYKGLEALSTVIKTQSFDLAAETLCITQSAVSQRIKSMEVQLGQPLLVRSLPYRAAAYGQRLVAHYRQVKLLEDELQLEHAEHTTPQTISIALNRDGLDTWFYTGLKQLSILNDIYLDIITDDEAVTIDYLKQGMVSACVSTYPKAIAGCCCHYMGDIRYAMVATPQFKQRYFSKSQHIKKNLLEAPAIIFDDRDKLHSRYLQRFFAVNEQPNYHVVPSVNCFREFTLQGYGYALIPEIDIEKQLAKGTLIHLFPKKVWEIPLYWHHWDLKSSKYSQLNEQILAAGSQRLILSK